MRVVSDFAELAEGDVTVGAIFEAKGADVGRAKRGPWRLPVGVALVPQYLARSG